MRSFGFDEQELRNQLRKILGWVDAGQTSGGVRAGVKDVTLGVCEFDAQSPVDLFFEAGEV